MSKLAGFLVRLTITQVPLVSLCAASLSLQMMYRSAYAQEHADKRVYISGRVTSKQTGEEIPGAGVGVLGTSRGAKANRDGYYRLALEADQEYRLRISAIGYRPDTIRVKISKDGVRDIALAVAPLDATITVTADASRTEARKIMHRVIDSKDAWRSAIHDYQFDVYSRANLRTKQDTTSKVLAVLESTAEGFWKKDAGYAERIVARKQTANLPAAVNRIALFDIMNLYNERIDLEDYDVVSPLAHDAFSRYDYDLLGTSEVCGTPVYKISVEPLNTLFPAFRGVLYIDQVDYTIAYLDLTPNEAIKLGPVQDVHLEQSFTTVDNKFWMPSQVATRATLRLQLPVVPTFYMEQNAVLQNYRMNGGLDDSLFAHRRHDVAASADSVDSVRWTAMRAIPLAYDEARAYHSYDSIAKLPPPENEQSPLGIAIELLTMPNVYGFNRVEGSRLQLSTKIDRFGSWPLAVGGHAAYGVADNRWKYQIDASQGLTWRDRNQVSASFSSNGDVGFSAAGNIPEVTSSIGVHVFDDYFRRGVAYDPLVNTATALLLHNDYSDYYRSRGVKVSFDWSPSRTSDLELYARTSHDFSLQNATDYSMFFRRDTFRTNPAIADGTIRELGLSASHSFELGSWSLHPELSATLGDQSFTNSLFAASTLALELEGRAGGWGTMKLSAKGSTTWGGALGNQQLYYFEGRNAVLAPDGVFRTMSPLEFQGDQLMSIMLEQNFYDLPTRILGIGEPGSLVSNVQWFGFANAGWSWLRDESRNVLATNVTTTGRRPLAEVGFGIGNILNLLRLDASWRLTHKLDRNFFVTGTVAFTL